MVLPKTSERIKTDIFPEKIPDKIAQKLRGSLYMILFSGADKELADGGWETNNNLLVLQKNTTTAVYDACTLERLN
ncbi:hypothetical protein GF366_03415 [Candidatus Peregrinibacteria bacterium]|nr:hypothetical protein [Candidatus Peregrinibacteria bacterium]